MHMQFNVASLKKVTSNPVARGALLLLVGFVLIVLFFKLIKYIAFFAGIGLLAHGFITPKVSPGKMTPEKSRKYSYIGLAILIFIWLPVLLVL